MLLKKSVFVILASVIGGWAVAFNPSPAQIQQFQNLPKAQQEQLARQYGVDISALTSQATVSTEEPKQMIPPERSTAPPEVKTRATSEEDKVIKAFGYDIFAGKPMDFTVDTLPVPLDYVMESGDGVKVQLYGKRNQELELVIDREGYIHFPEFGPVLVAGLGFEDLRNHVQKIVKQKVMGVEVVVSMGAMRTMQVFVVGELVQPGAYNVNGLTSLTQAIIASGGIKESGTLRNIQLKRKGQTIATLDLYELFLKGDTSKDIRLLAGDTLFVPSKTSNVLIEGEVNRPAIYELKGKTTLTQLLSIAGGAKPQAYLSKIGIKRITDSGVEQITVDLSNPPSRNLVIENGDEIIVRPISQTLNNAIAVRGEVIRQGAYNFKEGMRVNDVISSLNSDLKQNADLNYSLLVREDLTSREISVHQFSLLKAIEVPNSKDNLLLHERDQIFVFDNGIETDYWFGAYTNKKVTITHEKQGDKERLDAQTGALIVEQDVASLEIDDADELSKSATVRQVSREELLKPIVERLKAQSSYQSPAKLIEVSGAVRFPGTYPLAESESVASVIAAAGGLSEKAYLMKAELTRRNTRDDKFSATHHSFSLRDALDDKNLIQLYAQDHLVVKTQPNWQRDMIVELQGEVVFPGVYSFQRGETLKDIVERAGGFTRFAYPKGAVFSRERLKRQEQERLELLNLQLKQEIGGLALRRQNSSATYTTQPTDALAIADELAKTEAVGRLVIDLEKALEGDRPANVMLEKGDKLYVPAVNPTVAIMGEVQYASNHTFRPGMTLEEYVYSAGGTKKQADTDRIYVVKADGSVSLPNTSFWFSRKVQPLEPGDTIIVPIDTDYLDGLSSLTSATQILYQIGVAWSAVKD
ncbi:sugar transporter [Vibrio sp. T187]|uniref:SLBB domain-containing protein n=1 Tax=Vibrio TaxID=662 RepID=UPI0010C9C208|nr:MULTISPECIES: SLBB domain-containing protein [Vibrio]MBW3697577.1 sugar transporter [Vibrio sp. T187]